MTTQPKVDRFDLSKMVNSQLSQSYPAKNPKPFGKPEVKGGSDWQSRQLPNAVKSILKSAHNSVKPIPLEAFQPIAEVQPVIQSVDNNSNNKKKNTKSKKKLMVTRPFSYVGIPRYNYSIPQIQAAYEMKAMQRGRRPSNFMAQERAREILRQKNMLQDMLTEHQKLQKDRATIAQEIQSMKNYLGEIRKRLDTSLRKLSVNVNNPFEHTKKTRKNL